MYTSESLHSAVVEVVCKKGSRCRYTTIQNWANNIYNLVTKRAVAYADATMEWVDGNLGSQLTMKYPAVYMMEPGARGEILSIAFSSKGQHQDAGALSSFTVLRIRRARSSASRSQKVAGEAAIAAWFALRKGPRSRNAASFAMR